MKPQMVNCKICNSPFENDRSFHAHLKSHKIRMVEYYQTYYPRRDLFTKEIILFKNKEQYFSEDFNNRLNLKSWLKTVSEDESKEYLKQSLIKRKEKKDLKYALTQVELRSLISAPAQYYQKVFGDYYKLCESLGFENRFNIFPTQIITDNKYDHKNYSIFVDTREQTPLRFNFPIEIKTLNYGDYSFSDSGASCDCYIERKSLNDFLGTLSGGFKRFKNEIERANSHNAYLVVVVERNFNDCRSFNHLAEIKRKMGKIKITPDYIFHNVRALLQLYKNLQFLFVDGREESVRVIEKIFTSGCVYRQIDLQLAYDLEVL
jgi:hypothetical protein